MLAFLKFVDRWSRYAAMALVIVWSAALVFVMRNAGIQQFILDYGFWAGAALLVVSLAAGCIADRLEHTIVPMRYGNAFAILGFVVAIVSVILKEAKPPVPSIIYIGIFGLSLLIFAIAWAFFEKDDKAHYHATNT